MRTIQTMIDQEVLVCVSGLVSTLASGNGEIRGSHGSDLANLADQAFDLASPVLDYEEAARESGWSGVFPGQDFQDICETMGIEPHEREVFEHWAVTTWFADKLEAAGEKVDTDFAGMCVWARTTTGQAIEMDAVIERIYAEVSAS